MHCALCFEEINKVFWHNDNPYGSSCIKKITGSNTKKGIKYIKVNPINVIINQGKEKRFPNQGHLVTFEAYKNNKCCKLKMGYPEVVQQNGEYYLNTTLVKNYKPKG